MERRRTFDKANTLQAYIEGLVEELNWYYSSTEYEVRDVTLVGGVEPEFSITLVEGQYLSFNSASEVLTYLEDEILDAIENTEG